MTDEQRQAVKALSKCRFLPASWDKRFVRDMCRLAEKPDAPMLTEKQTRKLDDVTFKYRAQLEMAGYQLLVVAAAARIVKRTTPNKARPVFGQKEQR